MPSLSRIVNRVSHALAVTVLASACIAPLKLAKDDSPTVLSHQLLAAPNPSEKGPFPVHTLYYGSGTDNRRAEFHDSVTYKTRTVDGSKLAAAPSPQLGKERTKYWGFDF